MGRRGFKSHQISMHPGGGGPHFQPPSLEMLQELSAMPPIPWLGRGGVFLGVKIKE